MKFRCGSEIPAPGGGRPLVRAVIVACLGIAMFALAFAGERNEPKADPEKEKVDLHYYLKGRYIFQSQCEPCHGRSGKGDGPWSKDLKDKPRNFRAGVFKFRTTPYGFLPTDDDLRRTIKNGIAGTAMPFFEKLPDDDVTALIAYIKSLSRRWDDPALHAEPVPVPEIPAWLLRGEELPPRVKAGGELFKQTCVACHGETGRGDGPGSKGLVDVWGHPIVPADLGQRHHKSGKSMKDLYRTIAMGLDGTPMVGFLEPLGEEKIWDLVAYIKSIERAPEEGQ